MKSLYESILGSTNSGRNAFLDNEFFVSHGWKPSVGGGFSKMRMYIDKQTNKMESELLHIEKSGVLYKAKVLGIKSNKTYHYTIQIQTEQDYNFYKNFLNKTEGMGIMDDAYQNELEFLLKNVKNK